MCTRFRAVGARPYRVDVVAYYVGPRGLTSITGNAFPTSGLSGWDPADGRPPAEHSGELCTYLEKTGRDIEITTEGDIRSQQLG